MESDNNDLIELMSNEGGRDQAAANANNGNEIDVNQCRYCEQTQPKGTVFQHETMCDMRPKRQMKGPNLKKAS